MNHHYITHQVFHLKVLHGEDVWIKASNLTSMTFASIGNAGRLEKEASLQQSQSVRKGSMASCG